MSVLAILPRSSELDSPPVGSVAGMIKTLGSVGPIVHAAVRYVRALDGGADPHRHLMDLQAATRTYSR